MEATDAAAAAANYPSHKELYEVAGISDTGHFGRLLMQQLLHAVPAVRRSVKQQALQTLT
jgi:hypothetical protein